jgi:hypothetical protein
MILQGVSRRKSLAGVNIMIINLVVIAAKWLCHRKMVLTTVKSWNPEPVGDNSAIINLAVITAKWLCHLKMVLTTVNHEIMNRLVMTLPSKHGKSWNHEPVGDHSWMTLPSKTLQWSQPSDFATGKWYWLLETLYAIKLVVITAKQLCQMKMIRNDKPWRACYQNYFLGLCTIHCTDLWT